MNRSGLLRYWFVWLTLIGAGCATGMAGDPAGKSVSGTGTRVKTGAEVLITTKLETLRGKTVAVVVHAASRLPDGSHLVDTLLASGIRIRRLLAPEHGYRGSAEAGEKVDHQTDPQTGLEIYSLYGKRRKPEPAALADVDLVLFDLQDVGVRFFTYIATLQYVMEVCAELGKPLWVLDRPNPNADWVGGPVLEKNYTSFLGLQPVPVAYGLTIGEYAQLINGEAWLGKGRSCPLTVVYCENYRRSQSWASTGLPWVAPSPNLPTPEAARVYPATCWLEQTIVSEGRGTPNPFQWVGFPYHTAMRGQWMGDSLDEQVRPTRLTGLAGRALRFTPQAIAGKSLRPKFKDTLCWGIALTVDSLRPQDRMTGGLEWLANCYHEYRVYPFPPGPLAVRPFFGSDFEKLAGTAQIRKGIEAGTPPERLVREWQPEIDKFRTIRLRYLHYPD